MFSGLISKRKYSYIYLYILHKHVYRYALYIDICIYNDDHKIDR
jgi:hypothetical protein